MNVSTLCIRELLTIWGTYPLSCIRAIDNNCAADFDAPVGSLTVYPNCAQLRAARAFVIMAAIATGIAFICAWLASNVVTRTTLPYKISGWVFNVLGNNTAYFTYTHDHLMM